MLKIRPILCFILIQTSLSACSSKLEVKEKASPEYFSFCSQILEKELTSLFITKPKTIAENSALCIRDKKLCLNSFLSAHELQGDLRDPAFLKKWNNFSCSPLVYSKLLLLDKKAEAVKAFSQLHGSKEGLNAEIKFILEPSSFLTRNLNLIKTDCCSYYNENNKEKR